MKNYIDTFVKYTTKYSIEDCMGILQRKNIYDVFEYSFRRESYNSAEMVITSCKTHLCKNIRTVYKIEMEEKEKTFIYIKFINESYIFSIPFISKKWMDEFMKVKLDATSIE